MRSCFLFLFFIFPSFMWVFVLWMRVTDFCMLRRSRILFLGEMAREKSYEQWSIRGIFIRSLHSGMRAVYFDSPLIS